MAYVRNKHVSHTEQDSGHVDTVARPPEALAPDLYKQVRFPTKNSSCNLTAAANTLLLYSTNKSFSVIYFHTSTEVHAYATFALGKWNLDKKKKEYTASPSECRYMRSTLNCLDNQMTPVQDDENTWSHDKRPEEGPVWPWNSNYTMTNCMVKDVMLEEECEDCPVISPLGSIGNRTKSKSAVYNHLTIVWDDFLNKESKCDLKFIAEGTALLYNKKGEHPARLRDHTRQLDFLLHNPEGSLCPSTMKFNVSRLRGS